jgi:hypothetical protein
MFDVNDYPASFKPLFQNLLSDIPENEREGTKISFIVFSNTNHSFQHIDRHDFLNRSKELQQWGAENRLSIVARKGDEIFAYVSPQLAMKREAAPLLEIDGLKVKVKTLSEEEYKQMTLAGEAFRLILEQEATLAHLAEKKEHHGSTPAPSPTVIIKNYAQQKQKFLQAMERVPEKIKAILLRRWEENLIEIEHQKREEDKKRADKSHSIKEDEIEKSTRRIEIHKEEAQEQNFNVAITREIQAKEGHSEAEQERVLNKLDDL